MTINPSGQEERQPEQPPVLPFLQRLDPIPFAILALASIFVLYQGFGGLLTFLLFKADINPQNVGVFRWATLVGQVAFILLPTLWLARKRYPGTVNFFRWSTPDWKQLVLAIIAIFALQQLLQGYLLLQDLIPLPDPVEKLVDQFKVLLENMYRLLVSADSPAEFLFVLLVVALTPAICEELLFRGLIQQTLGYSVSGRHAAVITGVVFGLYHVNPFTLVPLVLLGMFFGLLMYRSQNISVVVVAHFFNNALACTVVYFGLDDRVALVGSETALNFGLFLVVFVLATYYYIYTANPARNPTGKGE